MIQIPLTMTVNSMPMELQQYINKNRPEENKLHPTEHHCRKDFQRQGYQRWYLQGRLKDVTVEARGELRLQAPSESGGMTITYFTAEEGNAQGDITVAWRM